MPEAYYMRYFKPYLCIPLDPDKVGAKIRNEFFTRLPLDPDKAEEKLRDEFAAGYTYGTLFSQGFGTADLVVDANGVERIEQFITAARRLIERAASIDKEELRDWDSAAK